MIMHALQKQKKLLNNDDLVTGLMSYNKPMRSTAKSSKHSTQAQDQNHNECQQVQNHTKLISNLVICQLLLSISSTRAHGIYNFGHGSGDEEVALEIKGVGNRSDNNGVDEDNEHGVVAPTNKTG